jgi:hypothetical protein
MTSLGVTEPWGQGTPWAHPLQGGALNALEGHCGGVPSNIPLRTAFNQL